MNAVAAHRLVVALLDLRARRAPPGRHAPHVLPPPAAASKGRRIPRDRAGKRMGRWVSDRRWSCSCPRRAHQQRVEVLVRGHFLRALRRFVARRVRLVPRHDLRRFGVVPDRVFKVVQLQSVPILTSVSHVSESRQPVHVSMHGVGQVADRACLIPMFKRHTFSRASARRA